MLGAASGGTGGPGMGFLVTLPVMLGSIAGGYLYGHNPAFPVASTCVSISDETGHDASGIGLGDQVAAEPSLRWASELSAA